MKTLDILTIALVVAGLAFTIALVLRHRREKRREQQFREAERLYAERRDSFRVVSTPTPRATGGTRSSSTGSGTSSPRIRANDRRDDDVSVAAIESWSSPSYESRSHCSAPSPSSDSSSYSSSSCDSSSDSSSSSCSSSCD